jgi:hypothetical protein
MNIELVGRVDSALSVQTAKFDGLPIQIICELDKLIEEYCASEIIVVIESMIERLEKEDSLASLSKGNSGYAGELHMIAALKVKYAKESIKYVSNTFG